MFGKNLVQALLQMMNAQAGGGQSQSVQFGGQQPNGAPYGSVGMYQEPGITSVGGHIGDFGGALGMDLGRLFGSVNKKGKIMGKFGPQGG